MSEPLKQTLQRMDGRSYGAYKDLRGSYDLGNCTLFVDHVQGDPFAAPSKIRIRVKQAVHEFSATLFENAVRKLAFRDFLTRRVHHAIQQQGRQARGSGKSGLVTIDVGGQEVLDRTSVAIHPDWVEVRLSVGLPAQGRRVLGREAIRLFTECLPHIVQQSLLSQATDLSRATQFVDCVENQEHLRAQLDDKGLIAFIADGALLPRQSGAEQKPLAAKQAKLFRSPDAFRVTLELLHEDLIHDAKAKTITGMGVKKGVTVIVGGGYHGKSTLLQALSHGVYPHIPGDGREYVITDSAAVKIRAEDGRRIESVDISPFISHLPFGQPTDNFSSTDASGSTSQAANIAEALELEARVLLVDEDTSATNFMVRDARMQALVSQAHEPICPFVDRVRELYEQFKVSTLLVMGGSGDYFDVADHVIMMRAYEPFDVSQEAKALIQTHPTQRTRDAHEPISTQKPRIPQANSLDASRWRRDVKIDVRSVHEVRFGNHDLDLFFVEQLVDPSQTRAVAYALILAQERFMSESTCLKDVVKNLENLFDESGLDLLAPNHRAGQHPGHFARPRRFEIAAALNRLRSTRIQ